VAMANQRHRLELTFELSRGFGVRQMSCLPGFAWLARPSI
jgi:hypothetical protein